MHPAGARQCARAVPVVCGSRKRDKREKKTGGGGVAGSRRARDGEQAGRGSGDTSPPVRLNPLVISPEKRQSAFPSLTSIVVAPSRVLDVDGQAALAEAQTAWAKGNSPLPQLMEAVIKREGDRGLFQEPPRLEAGRCMLPAGTLLRHGTTSRALRGIMVEGLKSTVDRAAPRSPGEPAPEVEGVYVSSCYGTSVDQRIVCCLFTTKTRYFSLLLHSIVREALTQV